MDYICHTCRKIWYPTDVDVKNFYGEYYLTCSLCRAKKHKKITGKEYETERIKCKIGERKCSGCKTVIPFVLRKPKCEECYKQKMI